MYFLSRPHQLEGKRFTLIFINTRIRKPIKKLKTLDISTTLFDNVAFVFFHVMETFSKDFLEVHGLRSPGFQLLLHEL